MEFTIKEIVKLQQKKKSTNLYETNMIDGT